MGAGQFRVGANAAYRAKTYYTVFKNDVYTGDADRLFGGNIRFKFGSPWFVEVVGNNLTNRLTSTNIIASARERNTATGALILGTAARFEHYAPPRTFGVRFGFKY